MKKLFYALAVLIICAVFVSSNAPKNDASAAELNNVTSCFAPCNGIKVTTTEKIKARPDVAYIYFC
ncbi:MAG: hypothetical protein FWG51_01100, partial [Firmicutes bacterium]|nr:hypothetical protein [Bacillota bacterium]